MKKYYVICYAKKILASGCWDYVNVKIDVDPLEWLMLKHAEDRASGLLDVTLLSSLEITKEQYDNITLPVS